MSDILEKYVYPALDAVRNNVENGDQLVKSPDMRLFGDGAPLSSLDVVYFVIEIEERIAAGTGAAVRLVSPSAMSRKNSPFRTLGSLAEYIDELLQVPR